MQIKGYLFCLLFVRVSSVPNVKLEPTTLVACAADWASQVPLKGALWVLLGKTIFAFGSKSRQNYTTFEGLYMSEGSCFSTVGLFLASVWPCSSCSKLAKTETYKKKYCAIQNLISIRVIWINNALNFFDFLGLTHFSFLKTYFSRLWFSVKPNMKINLVELELVLSLFSVWLKEMTTFSQCLLCWWSFRDEKSFQ